MSKGLTNFLFRLPFSLRQRHLARDRKALTETEFVGFTPYPEDSPGSVFGITEEEKDEDQRLRRSRDSP